MSEPTLDDVLRAADAYADLIRSSTSAVTVLQGLPVVFADTPELTWTQEARDAATAIGGWRSNRV